MTDTGPAASVGGCDSCGDTDVEVIEVTRLYVTPEAWDTEGSVTEADGTEHWCYPCRTHYPHVTSGESLG